MLNTSYLRDKSPITYLYEVCLKRGLTPVFEVENDLGQVHQKVFEVKVTAGEFVGRGTGSSKKKAKHLAAHEALKQLLGTVNGNGSGTESVPEVVEGEELNFRLENNPVSELQELTQKERLPLPVYEFEMSPGPPAVRQFTCSVHLFQLCGSGSGKSKKEAKRAAASNLLAELRADDLRSQLDSIIKSFINELTISDVRSAYQALKGGKRPSYQNNSSNDYLGAKSTRREMPSYCDLLQELAEEQKFEVTYVDLPEPTCTGSNQCIVQLSTMPVAVCLGAGPSVEEAHVRAALNALSYLGAQQSMNCSINDMRCLSVTCDVNQ